MRDRYEIKTEIDAAQEDLENNIAQLKDVISDKVDVRGKVHDRVEEKKAQAMDAVVRVRRIVLDAYEQAQRFVRDRPLVAVGIASGVLLAGTGLLVLRQRLRARAQRSEIRSFDDLILAIEDLRHRRR
jgi:ElaB/YqjD/DUF883 family membrane-anchored ribosome-binding protein